MINPHSPLKGRETNSAEDEQADNYVYTTYVNPSFLSERPIGFLLLWVTEPAYF